MTERTEPTRSKLVKLKQWLTVSEAAQYLALVCGEDVTDADVYQLALDGDLKISFRFVNATPGSSASSEPRETRDVWFEGVWDLPMSDGERHDVERAYQTSIGGPEVDMVWLSLGERFVESPDGTKVMVLEGDGSVPFSKYYAATSFPADGVFVVRTSALERLVQRVSDAPPESEMGTRERDTLLTIIGALCRLAKLPTDQPFKSAGMIEEATTLLGARVASRTIEGHLKRIPDVLSKKSR